MSKLSKALIAAAGNAGESLYVEDVFSTYLYTGNATARDITNGIDLAGEGGLVWIKNRDVSADHSLMDFTRDTASIGYRLESNTSNSEAMVIPPVTAESNGFGLPTSNLFNKNNEDFASWTFRKAEKFFDVVTYTGTGSTQNIAHNLGSVPACIIVKRTDGASNWAMYHTSLGNTKYMTINNYFGAAQTDSTFWNNTSPTDSQFTVGSGGTTNQSGGSYVAYIFASEDGGFGADGTENIIKCGTFNSGSSGFSVDLGFEPQWILIKDLAGNQYTSIYDTMRGWVTFDNPNGNRHLRPSVSSAEGGYVTAGIESTGFKWLQYANTDYIYIAIRRPMKTPESGTEVFGVNSYSETNDYQQLTTGNLVDLGWQYLNGDGAKFFTRLLGKGYLNPTSTAAANTSAASAFDFMDGFEPHYANGVSGFNPRMVYGFTRATGFFDVVAYTGEGDSSPQTINHNLNVIPELIIARKRAEVDNWRVHWPEGGTTRSGLTLNTTGAGFNGTGQVGNLTSESFDGLSNAFIELNKTYIAYLFASVAGVSKVGSYTGTGSNVDVDCGFSAGARFILIKRTDSTGDWYVWDSVRGIVAGNDPYLLLNSTAAEVTSTDYIDPLASGFTVTSTAPAALNASGGSFVYLAIA